MQLPQIRNIQIATHSRCNANCVFCPYIESWHHDHPGLMSSVTWNRIITELSSPSFHSGIDSGKICLYLMQEPLLDPRIAEKMDQIYSSFPNTTIEISTNGAALTPKRAEELLSVVQTGRRKLDFWISHHGTSSATVNEIMQINSSRATENILNFISRAHNTLDPEYCTLVLRGAGYDFSRTIKHFTKDEYEEYWEARFRERALKVNKDLLIYDYFGFHDRAGTIQRAERNAKNLSYGVVRRIDQEHPLQCARLTEWLHFMYDGSIVLCCMDYHREICLPNIMDITLEEYFKSSAYQELHDIFSGEQKAPDRFICTRCSQPTPPGLGRFKDGAALVQ